MNYRKDIDGLRAIAVLLVIFCHLDVWGFEGGFLGVDIFFVISGFLITANITTKLNEGRFSFKGFYLNRIKRIAPVLVIILLLLTIFNVFVLLPDPLKNYFDFLPYATLGLGNYAAANLGYGYFDAVSERYQLLHTWSLGVEEQFYLLVPVLFYLIWKIKSIKSRNILIISIYVISIAVSVYFVEFTTDFKNNYYLLHTRFFEIFTGSMLAVFYKNTPNIKSLLGITIGYLASIFALFYFSFIYNGQSSWPGINALIVSLTTIFILYLGKENNSSSKLKNMLEYSSVRFIGKISYSLYLWHWIIIATMVELGYDVNHFSFLLKMALLVFVMIPISYLSWKFIENTFRYRIVYKFKYAFALWVLLPFVCVVGLYQYQEAQPDKFYSKVEIDATSYKFSYTKIPHLNVKNNPLTRDVRKKYLGVEYFIGDYENRKKTSKKKEIETSDADVLILANSHFHAFKHFVDHQLKEKGLVAHVLHERTGNVYGFKDARERYSKMLQGKKYVVIWVRLDYVDIEGTKMNWDRWIVEEALKQCVQPIFYVPGIEILSENEARKNIYQNKIFGKSSNIKNNQKSLFSNIPTLEYVQTLIDDYENQVRWIDFKPLMCFENACNLWSSNVFALFDKHHITRQIGYELGREYDFKYENIFSKSWEQTPVLMNSGLQFENLIKNVNPNENELVYKEKGYTIKIDLEDKIYSITKDYDVKDDESMFFFHVFPEDLNLLQEGRRKYKFANFDVHGSKLKSYIGRETFYIGKNNLPDYKIKSIHFGHFKPKGEKYFEKHIMVNK
jgi:peptidoglycan/LPS O-acetylase OafA/YrhL